MSKDLDFVGRCQNLEKSPARAKFKVGPASGRSLDLSVSGVRKSYLRGGKVEGVGMEALHITRTHAPSQNELVGGVLGC